VWRPIPLAWAAGEGSEDLTTLNEVKRDKPSYFFSDRYREAWAPALRDLIVARFDAQVRDGRGASRSGKPWVIVKEPGSHVADLLLSLFPRSRLIFLLRDGRDVVDSWVAAHRRGAWALDEGAFAVSPEGREALVRWQSSVWMHRTGVVQRAYRDHDAGRKVVVRYESLLQRPAHELRRICESLGIPAERERLERIGRDHSYDSVPKSEKGADKEIRSAAPGGWRRHLTAAERRAMYDVMADKLAELGYLAGGYGERAA
jgi:hypothetical protein